MGAALLAYDQKSSGVLVAVVAPHLGNLAAPDAHHLAVGHMQVLVAPAAGGVLRCHACSSLASTSRSSAGKVPPLRERSVAKMARMPFPALMLASDGTSTRQAPDGILGEAVLGRGEVTVAEGCIEAPNDGRAGMLRCHG